MIFSGPPAPGTLRNYLMTLCAGAVWVHRESWKGRNVLGQEELPLRFGRSSEQGPEPGWSQPMTETP